MSTLELTRTRMRDGVWEGVVSGGDDTRPELDVTHLGKAVDDVELTQVPDGGDWLLRVPIPPQAICDGVQTLLIDDRHAKATIGKVTLIAGEALGEDLRAEVDLLRAELDMLKRAFRRHCLETG